MKFWKRPRTLVLSALLLVAGFMIWKDSQKRAEAGKEQVAAWVQRAVEQALAHRDVPPDMGETPAVVRDTLCAWVREAVPADRVPAVSVEVRSLRDSPVQQGSATHTAAVRAGRAAWEVDVEWDGKEARVVGARAQAEPPGAAAP